MWLYFIYLQICRHFEHLIVYFIFFPIFFVNRVLICLDQVLYKSIDLDHLSDILNKIALSLYPIHEYKNIFEVVDLYMNFHLQ